MISFKTSPQFYPYWKTIYTSHPLNSIQFELIKPKGKGYKYLWFSSDSKICPLGSVIALDDCRVQWYWNVCIRLCNTSNIIADSVNIWCWIVDKLNHCRGRYYVIWFADIDLNIWKISFTITECNLVQVFLICRD